jgi:hypothetical protein
VLTKEEFRKCASNPHLGKARTSNGRASSIYCCFFVFLFFDKFFFKISFTASVPKLAQLSWHDTICKLELLVFGFLFFSEPVCQSYKTFVRRAHGTYQFFFFP